MDSVNDTHVLARGCSTS